MRKYIVYILLLINCNILQNDLSAQPIKKDYSRQVDSLLQQMTLEEKVGQMIQYSNDKLQTGPTIKNQNHVEEIKKGMVGSMFNIITVERARQYQDLAMQSRLKIPLIFGLDVVHGMRTIFPIPLGEAASFDLKMIKKTARIAASETSAYGIHWTFAPMVDIARDARWGRGMEGAGEDTWYGSQVAKARIEGFQGTDYSRQNTVLACAKHLAAYGAALAGKDYAEADISDATLHQVYLPPFHSAVKAGVATLMTGFNEINGIPATAHKYLQNELLKEKWGFKGFTVSDWGSIGEIARHGIGKDNKDAARIAVIAGCDMDMHSMSYKRNLVDLVNEGQVDVNLINDAVKRILTLKYELGLFDDPYCYNNRYQELSDKKIIKEHRKSARLMGSKSIVLLKNNQVLPIQPHISNIALVGPLNKASKDMLGNWKAVGDEKEVVTVDKGLRNAIPHAQISYIEGYDLENNELKPLPTLDRFDMIIVAVGERAMESGEARSKVDINIHKNQQLLVKQLKEKSNKPVVALIMGGRPLIFSDMEPYADGILMTWWLGSEAGNSVADVLTGKYNPSGKLPVTFPKQVGQCPIYYNQKRTGRPWIPNNLYVSGYCDETALPAYPFGFGLSYTQFEIDTPVLEKEKYFFNEPIKVKVKVRNNGKHKGIETVQLYLQDVVSSITRPFIELCGIRQVELAPKEEKIIEFTLFTEDLSFYNHEKAFITEPGEFKLFAGNSSDNLRATSFELLETRISSNK
ncbi:glycosyl hydrolase [Bacteroides xylanisolvens]|uniref:beta-glucosidase n=1 Tax=Bacteroides xylanisolvens TaxID=371601 RepID=A0A415I1D8_9BACE|nr:glycoside hydrolase family 3 N-terminal domain-containing protein [Bacteroides xylanisolvens]RHL01459.1 glycosyl hydrolase [Bacteroides xylanisolvens]